MRTFAAAVLILGLSSKSPTSPRANDEALTLPALIAAPIASPIAEALPPAAPAAASTSCGVVSRDLRFGWIDSAEEIQPPAPRGAAACLAVYQLPDAPRPVTTRE